MQAPPDWLQALSSHCTAPENVEVIQTPLSWVFLTERHAFKVKKPVDLGEAQFRSPARRQRACMDELWLNRRFASGVYLGVLPVSRSKSGRLVINGKGAAVDWVIKMRRLPDDRSMLSLMNRDELTSLDIKAVAKTLSEFYVNRPPETVLPGDYRTRLVERVRDTQEQLQAHLPTEYDAIVQRIHAAQLSFLVSEASHLDARVCDGRIVDGHGDLRPEHVYLQHRPMIIDCLEFSAGLRQVDALDDLCFLAMECDRHGRPDVGDDVIGAYAAAAGDDAPKRLCAFYKSHRACIRAKVAAMSIAQGADREQQLTEAAAYLEQAKSYLPALNRPTLLLLKTSRDASDDQLAEAIAGRLSAALVPIEASLQAVDESSGESDSTGAGESDVSEERLACRRCRQLLAQGRAVVLFGHRAFDQAAVDAAALVRETGAVALAVESSRVGGRRGSAGGARPSVESNGGHSAANSGRGDLPPLARLVVSSTATVEENARQVFRELDRQSDR